MPTKYEILNIPSVIEAFENFLKQSHQTNNFITFISQLNNHLKQLELIITNQYQFTNYQNQSHLISQAIKEYENTLKRASVEINKLLTNIKEYGNRHQIRPKQEGDETNNNEFELLNYAHATLSLIQKNIYRLLTRLDSNISYLENYYRSAFKKTKLLEMTALFRGRFLPFSQTVDPFLGYKLNPDKTFTEIGGCHGDTLEYANNISMSGKIDALSFYKTSIHIAQNQQDMFAYNNKFILYQVCDDDTDFRDYMFKLLVNSKRGEMFLLTMVFQTMVHALFYRYIENEEAIEFADPNVGIFVFDNIENFINWSAAYLMEIYFEDISKGERGGALALRSLGKQPASSTASIQHFFDAYDQDENYQFNNQQIYSIAETAKLHTKTLVPFNNHYYDHLVNAHLLKFLIGAVLSGLFLLTLLLKSTTEFNIDNFGIIMLIGGLPFMMAAGLFGTYTGFMADKLKDKIHEDGIINKDNYQNIATNLKQQRKSDKKPSMFSLFNISGVDIIDKYASIKKPNESKILTV